MKNNRGLFLSFLSVSERYLVILMKKRAFLILCLILSISILTACTAAKTDTPKETDVPKAADSTVQTGQRLQLSVTPADGNFPISEEELGGNFHGINYTGLSEVAITLDRVSYPLEQAIRDGRITVEELEAYAKIDARNGFCREVYSSHNGLASFEYCYLTYKVAVTNDVYELPSGKTHRVHTFSVNHPNVLSSGDVFIVDPNSPYGYSVDREDWGLTLEVLEVTADSLVIRTHQQGGMQLGTLSAAAYLLLQDGSEEILFSQSDEAFQIVMEGEGEAEIDLAAAFGSLAPGKYLLQLRVEDTFDPEQVHPLMRDYAQAQSYYVEFTAE